MELSISLNAESTIPLYRQLYQQVRAAIVAGSLLPSTKLPPTRELAAAHGIARVTAIQAYDQLEAEGFVVRRRGAGTFVAEALPLPRAATREYTPVLSPWGQRVVGLEERSPRSRPPGQVLVDFSFGRSFPHIFPYPVWRRLLARYLSTDDVMLSRYGSVAGFHPLRVAIAGYLAGLRGVQCSPEQIVIVNGAQQALDILARLFLTEGDEVLVETPGYTAAFSLLQAYGARLTAVSVDEHGFPVEAIPSTSEARLVFVTPANQFPRGGAMPAQRRLALLRWAEERSALIIEDDYDGALRYEGQPLAALQGLDRSGHVIYLGTFSKVLFPALRLGYVVLPPALLPAFIQAKSIVDRGAPTLTQAAVADFITEGHFERHLRRLRATYGRRRTLLVRLLRAQLGADIRFAAEPAGLHIMLYLDPGCDEASVVANAAATGVGVYPGAPYHLQENPPPSILLGFSGLSADEIESGIRLLAKVLPTPAPS